MRFPVIARAAALAIAACTSGVVAQSTQPARPDFSGEWRLVANPQVPVAWIGSPLGKVGVIVQDATTLTINRTDPAPEDLHSYDLTGGETRWTASNASGSFTSVLRPRWIEHALIVSEETTRAGQAVSWASMHSFSLNAEGELIVVGISPTLRQGPFMATTLLTYRKAQ
jgi:hypothetical protein